MTTSSTSEIISKKLYFATRSYNKDRAYIKGSGCIYVTVTFFKSRVSSFFNIFGVAKKFINFIIDP